MSKVSVSCVSVCRFLEVNNVCGATSGELLTSRDVSDVASDGRVIVKVSDRGSKVKVVDCKKSSWSVRLHRLIDTPTYHLCGR